jgi:hypothetical protein
MTLPQWEHGRWRRIGCLTVFFLFLALLPAACRYQPPLKGVEGYQTILVSDPGYWGGPVKWTQDLLEQRPCAYELLGWRESGLYYQAVCYGREQTFSYDLARQSSTAVNAVPGDLYAQPIEDRAVLEIVWAPGLRPVEAEPYTRPLFLVDGSALRTPDGGAIAFITRRVYSVHDVVIVTMGK